MFRRQSSDGLPFRLSAIALALLGGALPAGFAAEQPAASTKVAASAQSPVALEFNSEFLRGNTIHAVDLSRYALGNPVVPGRYLAEVYVNGRWLGKLDIEILRAPTGGKPELCLDRPLAQRLNIDLTKVAERVKSFVASKEPALGGSRCLRVEDLSSAATSSFDPSEIRLDLSIPQALIVRAVRGYVPPESWDAGVRAASAEYRFNSYHTWNGDPASTAAGTSTRNYLGLTARANVGGGWQLTHNGALNWGSYTQHSYQAQGTFATHDVPAWKSRAVFGDAYTDGQLFDSVSFRGVQLATDERMLPDSQRGYGPVIRGTARGNATVTVRQNGALLTEIIVPPGPFEITDVYPSGYGGNLVVTVTESDGSQSSFTVAYAAGPLLLRESQLRYQVVTGELRSYGNSNSKLFELATAQYGLTNSLTGNVGLTAMPRYGALLVGGAMGTPLGAIAMSLTASRFTPEGYPQSLTGSSFNASYSVLIPQSKTNVTFAAYRYNTPNYYSLAEAGAEAGGYQASSGGKARNRAVVSMTQSLGDRAGFGLSASYQGYWAREGYDLDYQASFSYQLLGMQMSLGVARSKSASATSTTQTSLSLNVPLGAAFNAGNVSSNYTHSSAYGSNKQATVSGVADPRGTVSYSLTAVQDDTNGTVASANGSWRSPVATFGGSLSGNRSTGQSSVSVSGGVVVHEGGITLAPSLGETFAIVGAKEAAGADLAFGQGLQLNERGYAIIPYLSPYKVNEVELDLRKASLDVEMESTSRTVAPHAGAAVEITFKGRTGRSALILATLSDNTPLPLGTIVTDRSGQVVGSVGQGGRIEVRVNADADQLVLSWGDGDHDKCLLDYVLPAKVPGEGFARTSAICRLSKPNDPTQTSLPLPPVSDATTFAPDGSVPSPERRVPVLLAATTRNGKAIPAGSQVTDREGFTHTTVASDGRIFVRLPTDRASSLMVRWGGAADEQCSLSYIASPHEAKPNMARPVPLVCAPAGLTQASAASPLAAK